MSELVKVRPLVWEPVVDWLEALDPVFGTYWQVVTFGGRSKAICCFGHDKLEEIGLDCDAEAMNLTVEKLRTARILAALDLSAVEALQAENKRLLAALERGKAACDWFNGPAGISDFVDGQATAAQQISAALEATDGQ